MVKEKCGHGLLLQQDCCFIGCCLSPSRFLLGGKLELSLFWLLAQLLIHKECGRGVANSYVPVKDGIQG